MSLMATYPKWRSAAGAAALLVAVATAGFFTWEQPVRREAQATRRALALGKYDVARGATERWLRLRPRSADAHYYRAKVAIAQGRSRDIYEGLKQAEALGCPEERLAVLRALLDAQHGRLARARAVLATAFAASSGPDPMLDEALARVYLDAYDFPHAGAVLDRWAKDAPDDPRPPLWHANVHLRRDAEPEVLIADYREVLRRDPNSAEARLGLAEQLERAQQNSAAADAYTALLALRPDDPGGHLGAGRNALALGDEASALHHLDRALELDPESAAGHLERAKLDLRHGDAGAALAHLDRAIARSPSDPAAHYQRSLALKRLARDDEASREQDTFNRLQRDRRQLEDLQERLGETPGDVSLQARVARWMFEHAYDDEAVKWCGKILTDRPGHPETCVLLADYYSRHGQPEKAAAVRRLATPGPARAAAPQK
ncbi:MAG: tetratricopeptide repeat protein [Isosphaeraceae bacterium]|nr:tetratricopeptide repeat protein [Isosphaeraceae bacterium]